MIAVVGRDQVDPVRRAADAVKIPTWVIGEVRPGTGGVRFTSR
jgi:hypothetical protein